MVLPSLAKDLRYAFRQLRHSPGFTAVAVLSLALGIGANTAIFQLVDAIGLRTLPARNPAELVSIDFAPRSVRSGSFSTRSARLTYRQWQEIRGQQQGFSGVVAWSAAGFDLASGGAARFAEGLFVSGDFFQVLGIDPLLGRTFSAQDDTAACSGAGAVVSHSFWQRELGADPAAVGRRITVDGHSFPVIGVTPRPFFGVEVGQSYDVALPLCADRLLAADGAGRIPDPQAWWLSVMGRLAPGWTLQRARTQLQAISPAVTRASLPPTYKPATAARYLANKLDAVPGGSGVSRLREDYEGPLWLLLATTALVLLIACANLANLLLARATVREREMAVRLAIGASRGRLVRQLLAESLLLAIGGAALGAMLARSSSSALLGLLGGTGDPLFVDLALDWRVLGFTAALAMGTCVLFGLVPALRATHLSPAGALRTAGRGATAGRERLTLRRTLVVTQVALSLVLLVSALLFVRTLRNLVTTEAGFQAEGVLAIRVDLARMRVPPERRQAVYRQLADRLSSVPGVVSAAEVWFTPVSGSGWNNDVGPDGTLAAGSGKRAFFNRVGPGYFHTMGTALLAGREFSAADNLSARKVAIVNEVFARKVFGTPQVVGRTFRLEAEAGKPEPLLEIVGVVSNTKYYTLREDFLSIGFFPAEQAPAPDVGTTFVVRAHGSPGALMQAIEAAVVGVSPAIGLQFKLLSAQLEESLLRERLMATLSTAFALLAVLLATLGLYGVVAYMVARRQNEIGLRIALGADRGRVIRLVLRETVLLLAMGLAVGTVLALAAGRAAASLLYGLRPTDPLSLVASAALLAGIALLASFGPARRAAALEPMAALRTD
jgi:putative ABC transport system permease protein